MQMRQRLSRLETRSATDEISIRVVIASDGGGPDDNRPPIMVRVVEPENTLQAAEEQT